MITHWSSTLMAINPNRIERHEGNIVRVAYNSADANPVLILTIKRRKDSLEGTILFGDLGIDMFGEGEDEEKPPNHEVHKVIRDVYEDFSITEASQLLGRNVLGLYYSVLDRLVGLEKK